MEASINSQWFAKHMVLIYENGSFRVFLPHRLMGLLWLGSLCMRLTLSHTPDCDSVLPVCEIVCVEGLWDFACLPLINDKSPPFCQPSVIAFDT